ncbi:hypothetical protein ES703_86007 [subsurface metagenome]
MPELMVCQLVPAVPRPFRDPAGLPLPILNYPGGAESAQILNRRLVVVAMVLTDRKDTPYSTHLGDSGNSCYLPLRWG